MNWPNNEQLRHWWNIIHMETDEEKKLKKRRKNMKGHPAGAAAMRTFKNTANRGSYKNSPKIQPRGGTSFK